MRNIGMKQYFRVRASSGLVSVIVILDRVLRATNFWQFLLIWWTTDPASLAKVVF